MFSIGCNSLSRAAPIIFSICLLLSGCAAKRPVTSNIEEPKNPIEFVRAKASSVGVGSQKTFNTLVTVAIQRHEYNRKIVVTWHWTNTSGPEVNLDYPVLTSEIQIGNGLEEERNDAYRAPVSYTCYYALRAGTYKVKAVLHRSNGAKFTTTTAVTVFS